MMKPILLFLAGTLGCHTLFAQIPNAGFENLTDDGNISYWGNNFMQVAWLDSLGVVHGDSIVFDQHLLFSTTDAHTGSRAMEMRNAYNYSAGENISGQGILSSMPEFSSFNVLVPVTSRPEACGFSYKFFPAGDDMAAGHLSVRDADGAEIGFTHIVLAGHSFSYLRVSAPVTYTGNAPAAYVAVSFETAAPFSEPVFGTRFLVDDVFLEAPMSVSEAEGNHAPDIYPNPADASFNIFSTDAVQTVSVRNMAGMEVAASTAPVQQMDCSRLPVGAYLVTMATAKGNFTKKIFIQR